MITIRDEEVRTLAQTVMRKRGVANMTAAIKLALQNEIKHADEAVPLISRVRQIVERAKAKAIRQPEPDAPDSRDDMWDR